MLRHRRAFEGLTSSDTGEQRAAALESFNNNINEFQEKIEEIVAINTSIKLKQLNKPYQSLQLQ